jgi:hypothetical protein
MQEQHLSQTSPSKPSAPSFEGVGSKLKGGAELNRFGIAARHISYPRNGCRYSDASSGIVAAKRKAR